MLTPETPSTEDQNGNTTDNSFSTESSENEKYDIFDVLRKLKNENKNRPVSSHLNINSIRYKFDDLKQILDDNLTDLLIVSETKMMRVLIIIFS